MAEFWKAAWVATGIAGVVSFVLWSLYRDWLKLDVFQRMTKRQQFILFMTFLILTFLFGLAGLGTYAYVSTPTGGSEPERTVADPIDGEWEHSVLAGGKWDTLGVVSVSEDDGQFEYVVTPAPELSKDFHIKHVEHKLYDGDKWDYDAYYHDTTVGFFRYHRDSKHTFRGTLTTDNNEPPSQHKLVRVMTSE